MQAEIELGCKITELEEINAGLRLVRDPEADGPVPEMFIAPKP